MAVSGPSKLLETVTYYQPYNEQGRGSQVCAGVCVLDALIGTAWIFPLFGSGSHGFALSSLLFILIIHPVGGDFRKFSGGRRHGSLV